MDAEQAVSGRGQEVTCLWSVRPLPLLRRHHHQQESLIRRIPVNGLVIGDVPVWDSLRHIQLMMDLEAALDIRFSSNEIAQTTTYGGLSQLCVEKLQSN